MPIPFPTPRPDRHADTSPIDTDGFVRIFGRVARLLASIAPDAPACAIGVSLTDTGIDLCFEPLPADDPITGIDELDVPPWWDGLGLILPTEPIAVDGQPRPAGHLVYLLAICGCRWASFVDPDGEATSLTEGQGAVARAMDHALGM